MSFTSWWLNQPLWKILARQIGSFSPIFGDEHKKNIESNHQFVAQFTTNLVGFWVHTIWNATRKAALKSDNVYVLGAKTDRVHSTDFTNFAPDSLTSVDRESLHKKIRKLQKKSNYKNSASGLYLHFGIFSNKPSWPTLSTWYGCIIHLQTSHKKSRLLADLMFFHLRPLPSSLQRDLLSVLVIFPELDVLHVGFRVKVKILKLLVMSGPDLCTDLEQIWRGNAKKHDTYNTKIDIEYVCILK